MKMPNQHPSDCTGGKLNGAHQGRGRATDMGEILHEGCGGIGGRQPDHAN